MTLRSHTRSESNYSSALEAFNETCHEAEDIPDWRREELARKYAPIDAYEPDDPQEEVDVTKLTGRLEELRREALVESAEYSPTWRRWFLVQRTLLGPNYVKCKTKDLEATLIRLGEELVGDKPVRPSVRDFDRMLYTGIGIAVIVAAVIMVWSLSGVK